MKAFFLSLFAAFTLAASAQDKPEGLFINSKAPDFSGTDQNGNKVSLKELKKKGPVVVLFYRGNWCPYCNRQLKNLQDSLQLITDKKASIVAITQEATPGIQETVKKTGAAFPILHDAESKWSKAYGVNFAVDERTIRRYKTADIDLLAINNQKEAASLPVPAVYIINRDGSITYRYFDADYRNRLSVRELAEQIK
ncbi:peroxiredoxin-like family protein [Flaviaesturariibacter amylovorans]|uniref:thioredoxin-dependent peroxiredoxin n=1 Tax=Flaviaesturariibacter amylovorans TaxID=1084520 RepID=A0ABP8GUT9_9BACT